MRIITTIAKNEYIIQQYVCWILLIILTGDDLIAQSYQKIYNSGNHEGCVDFINSNDGKYIGVGGTAPYSPGQGSYGIHLFKTDEWGNFDWSKIYSSGDTFEVGMSIVQTFDDGFIITGYSMTNTAGSYDAALLKLDEQGNVEWFKSYGGINGDWGASVIQTNDSGYVLTGTTLSFTNDTSPFLPPALRRDMYIIRTKSDGDTLWTRTFSGGGGGTEQALSIVETDGGCIVGGTFNAVTASVAKFDFEGDTVWTKHFLFDYVPLDSSSPGDTARNDLNYIYSIKKDMDGGYIVTGMLDQSINTIHDIYLMKTDSAFNPLWAKSYSPSTIAYQLALTKAVFVDYTPDGGYIIAGHIYNYDAFLMKTNGTGDVLWVKQYDGADNNFGYYSVAQTPENGFLIGTWLNNITADSTDVVYLIKTDSMGNSGKNCNEINLNFLQNDLTIKIIQGGFIGNTETVVTDLTSFTTVSNYILYDSLLCDAPGDINSLVNTASEMLIFPNPTSGNLSIEFINTDDLNGNLTLFNAMGQIVKDERVNSLAPVSWNISEFSAGIYLVRYLDNENVFTQKITKN